MLRGELRSCRHELFGFTHAVDEYSIALNVDVSPTVSEIPFMARPLSDHWEFFRQFRERFETTGAIVPSSRFLANAMTGPLRRRDKPARILEIGPGTGAVTRRIVQLMQPEDRFDLVEVNDRFAEILDRRFETEAVFQKVADRSAVHVCFLQDFKADAPYDFIISGLPLNNFSSELVGAIFDCYFQLLAPDGVLSYFEYMYVRPVRSLVTRGDEKGRLKSISSIMDGHIAKHRIYRSWVFVNIPPAWVQHLRVDAETPSQPQQKESVSHSDARDASESTQG